MAGGSSDDRNADSINRLRGTEGGLTVSFNNKLRVAQLMADQMEQDAILASTTVAEVKEAKENLRNAGQKLEACLNELRTVLEAEADKKIYEDKLARMT